ncbi:MAG TPA: arsenite methyltransferase [Terriglobales bacterium]|nr:arsenite methyltransferase [Terriglobales bacterium]
MDKNQVLEIVQEKYGEIARGERSGCGCGSKESVAAAIGYSKEELELAGSGNLGLGCGNPLALAEIKLGMTVLDLGSGAGFDVFLALRQVGPGGRVIGVDMTDDMLTRARENAANLGASNVEFRKGHIENLPIEDGAVDFIISNCVINLSPDKPAVFREMQRVLKPGGRFAVSDIVLLAELPVEIATDINAYVGCISGASLMNDYLRFALGAGLTDLSIPQITAGTALAGTLLPQDCCAEASKFHHPASAIASIKLHGRKPL